MSDISKSHLYKSPPPHPEANKEFGEFLRKKRHAASKTMGELASHLKMSVSSVSDIEVGRGPVPDAGTLLRIAAFLKVDSGEIFKKAGRVRM